MLHIQKCDVNISHVSLNACGIRVNERLVRAALPHVGLNAATAEVDVPHVGYDTTSVNINLTSVSVNHTGVDLNTSYRRPVPTDVDTNAGQVGKYSGYVETAETFVETNK